MKKPAKASIEVQGIAIAISIIPEKQDDYICLTDIARYKNADATDDLIRNWLRNRNTVEFLGIWERLNNPDFKPVEFDGIKMKAGLNSYSLRNSAKNNYPIYASGFVAAICSRALCSRALLEAIVMNHLPSPLRRSKHAS